MSFPTKRQLQGSAGIEGRLKCIRSVAAFSGAPSLTDQRIGISNRFHSASGAGACPNS